MGQTEATAGFGSAARPRRGARDPVATEQARLETLAALFVVMLAIVTFLAPLPIAAIGALGVLGVTSRFPRPALALVLVSVPFSPLTRPIGTYAFSPTEILIVLTSLAGAARGVTRFGELRALWREVRHRDWLLARRRIGDPFVAVLAVVFALVAVLSLTVSVEPHQSLQSLRTIIAEPLAFYLLIVTQLRGRRSALLLVLALVLGGVLISLVGDIQYLTDQRIITAEQDLRRIRGFYGSPNNLGLFLGRALPLAVALALWWRRGRVLATLSAAVIAVALFLTFSLGAWIAAGLSLLAVAALHGRRALSVAFGCGLVALVALGVAALKVPRIGEHFNPSLGTSFIRLDLWAASIHMVLDHPLRGVGLDNFLYYYQHGYRLPTAWQEPDLSHPHNVILDFWLSLGLPGLLVLLALLWRFAGLLRLTWQQQSAVGRGLLAGVAGMLVDTLAHGMIDNSYFLPDLAVLFWGMFAIVGVLSRGEAVEPQGSSAGAAAAESHRESA